MKIFYLFSVPRTIIFLIFLIFLNKLGHIKTQICKEIIYKPCKNLHYNHTEVIDQDEASRSIFEFLPVIKENCSSFFQNFICEIKFPKCDNLKSSTPCRQSCTKMKELCNPSFKKFDLKWPNYLDCNLFTVDTNYCTMPPGFTTLYTIEPSINTSLSTYSPDQYFKFSCPAWMATNSFYRYSLQFQDDIVPNCGQPCSEPFLFPEKSRRQFAHYWGGIWAVICLCISLITFLTFLLNRREYIYPERPIVLLSMCCIFVSVGHIIGFVLGDVAICSTNVGVTPNTSLLVHGTSTSHVCSIIFLLTYFFSMAGVLWWLTMTLTWFLSVVFHWAEEAIDSRAHIFHLISWGIPCLKTLFILASGEIDGDPTSGVCSTGITNRWYKLALLIIPCCIYLVLGLILYLTTLYHHCKLQTILKRHGNDTQSFQNVLVRFSIFNVLILFSLAVRIGMWTYEFLQHNSWMTIWHARLCRLSRYGEFGCPAGQFKTEHHVSLFALEMLALFSGLAMVSFSTTVLWDRRLKNTWRHCFKRHRLAYSHESDIEDRGGPVSTTTGEKYPERGVTGPYSSEEDGSSVVKNDEIYCSQSEIV